MPAREEDSSFQRPLGREGTYNLYESTRVQLCGTFAVELSGQRVDDMLPGRQGRLLFAYLALSRLQPVSRGDLIDALWGDDRPADAGGALNALVSKTRAVVGGDVLRGRTELILALPEPARVDVEAALSMLHAAESAVASGGWRRAWSPALGALIVAQRTFLPEAEEAPWAEVWRRRLTDVRVRALESYAKSCLGIGALSCRARSGPRVSLSTWHRFGSQASAFNARARGERQCGGGARGVRTAANLAAR
ncbi:MAG TPA: DNA-binding protein [Propionibacteriaceae bacterium]|nr:DNA-binding protein [Propionibacteriaceae bacterium]